MGIMSGQKDHFDQKTNEKNHQELQDHFKTKGYQVTPVDGVYKGESEKSVMIVSPKIGNDNGVLQKDMIERGKHYDQESILHKAHDSDVARLHYPDGSKKATSIGKLHLGITNSDNHTKLPNGKTFTFGENITITSTGGGQTFHDNAANDDDLNGKLKHLHKWVNSTGHSLHFHADRPGKKVHSGDLHPNGPTPFVEGEVISLKTKNSQYSNFGDGALNLHHSTLLKHGYEKGQGLFHIKVYRHPNKSEVHLITNYPKEKDNVHSWIHKYGNTKATGEGHKSLDTYLSMKAKENGSANDN